MAGITCLMSGTAQPGRRLSGLISNRSHVHRTKRISHVGTGSSATCGVRPVYLGARAQRADGVPGSAGRGVQGCICRVVLGRVLHLGLLVHPPSDYSRLDLTVTGHLVICVICHLCHWSSGHLSLMSAVLKVERKTAGLEQLVS